MTRQRWEPSPPPQEDWENDAETEWAVKGIVSEQVDALGVKRYEVKWDDWHRQDGTNTTWAQGLPDRLTQKWDKDRKNERVRMAVESRAMSISLQPFRLWHEDSDIEVAHAYVEKDAESQREGLSRYANWDNIRTPRGISSEDNEESVNRPRLRARPSSASATANHASQRRTDRPWPISSRTYRSAASPPLSVTTSRERRSTTLASGPSSSTRLSSTRVTSASPAAKSDLSEPSYRPTRALPRRIMSSSPEPDTNPPSHASPASEARPIALLPRRKKTSNLTLNRLPFSEPVDGISAPAMIRRAELQKKWSAAAEHFGAAKIAIFNGVNDEAIPPGLNGFQYCEHHYVRSPSVPNPQDTSDCIVSCECDKACTSAWVCGCQDASQTEILNEFEERDFAYDSKGLFKFNVPAGIEVLECNKRCTCVDGACPNRVAQKPRSIPIEIFRTQECGWGVRSPVDLVRGRVLGVYTGELITRAEADQRVDDRKSYIFDLDFHEDGGDDDDGQHSYSVDSYNHGNWTRFLNHSCEPNARVYPVIWDTIPELNQPYLAIVATKAVPAWTEITIDYDPKAAIALTKGKGKAKSKMPPGARPCVCGAAGCRGWVRV